MSWSSSDLVAVLLPRPIHLVAGHFHVVLFLIISFVFPIFSIRRLPWCYFPGGPFLSPHDASSSLAFSFGSCQVCFHVSACLACVSGFSPISAFCISRMSAHMYLVRFPISALFMKIRRMSLRMFSKVSACGTFRIRCST